jgi:glucose/arabinose dehydrogenase
MTSRVLKGACATAAVTAALGGAAQAAGPPPPTAANGAPVVQVASGLGTPTSFAFGGGVVFEGDGGNNQSGPPNGGVFVLRNGTATKLAGSPAFVAGLAWRHGTLYISGENFVSQTQIKSQLLAWSGWNGSTFTKHRVLYTAPKRFQGFNGIAFGPDGRLYAGVDVGFTNNNDHGRRSTSPFLYDILSFKANGKDLRVFARGIRQPWQMTFVGRNPNPFVSDLGQDSPPNLNPPDFVLRVRRGQDYGFPRCTWVKPSACRGFAKPFRFFAPHTDVMGLAIVGKRLYMSEFGKQQVVSMPLGGGPVKPLVTGFAAPIVGLGADAGYIYIGEVTGQIFRVKV